jgi:hypothetical protein
MASFTFSRPLLLLPFPHLILHRFTLDTLAASCLFSISSRTDLLLFMRPDTLNHEQMNVNADLLLRQQVIAQLKPPSATKSLTSRSTKPPSPTSLTSVTSGPTSRRRRVAVSLGSCNVCFLFLFLSHSRFIVIPLSPSFFLHSRMTRVY